MRVPPTPPLAAPPKPSPDAGGLRKGVATGEKAGPEPSRGGGGTNGRRATSADGSERGRHAVVADESDDSVDEVVHDPLRCAGSGGGVSNGRGSRSGESEKLRRGNVPVV